MNAPNLIPPIPEMLLRRQPPAQFGVFADGQLLIAIGETVVVLPPEDIRRLDAFMGKIGGVSK